MTDANTTHSDERLMSVTLRLAHNRKAFPQLQLAEAHARLELAAAIWAYETSLLEHGVGRDNPELALLAAHAEVATDGYVQALANLMRGDEPGD